MTSDPWTVPPSTDPLGDPGDADLHERLDGARALLDALRPVTDAAAFLSPEAVEAAAIVRDHDVAYYFRLHQELHPHNVVQTWKRAIAAAGRAMADLELKVAEKTRLIAIAIELLELWHDGAEAWCWPKEHGPGCCWRMPSGEAKRHLLAAYGERHKADVGDGVKAPSAPPRQAVAEVMDQLEAMAHAGQRRPEPALRVAGDGARLVLDLCRDDYTVVVVEDGGWRVVKPSPLALRRAPGMRPLPLPVVDAGDALGELRTLLGFDGGSRADFWALYVGFMFAALRPLGPYFVLVLAGEQGTGKTTTIRVLRAPLDPHKTDVQSKPRTEDDLFVNCDGQWLLAYDNLSALDQHWSDAFCRISTGSGYSKRKLYTDRDTTSFQVARPQVITSIVDVAAAPDLLDRSLLGEMPELEGFKVEAELLVEAEALMPRVLGQLLDAAAVALRGQEKVELSTVPRMVDATRWIEAAAEVLGLEPGGFLAAYLDSQGKAGEMALEASLIGMPLRDMLDGRDALAGLADQTGSGYAGPVGFEGTAKDLLTQLNDSSAHRPFIHGRGWPRTPRAVAGALRRIAPALRKLGYVVTFAKVGHARTRTIAIDTPFSIFRKTTHNAKHRPHSTHRPHQGVFADGADGADGRMHTQSIVRDASSGAGVRENGPAAGDGGQAVASAETTAAPQRERKTTSKPPAAHVITQKMKAQLLKRGVHEGVIAELRPADAHRMLDAPETVYANARRSPEEDLRELAAAVANYDSRHLASMASSFAIEITPPMIDAIKAGAAAPYAIRDAIWTALS